MNITKSNNSIDRCESDSREIPLNGFNRFDPKYISIGPKALRDTSLTSKNMNKCATLRQGGRYGGSLTERRMNPVLKKASPPSVTYFPKKINCTKSINTNVLNNNINTIYDGSNTSPTTAGISGYETDSGTNFSYKRSMFKPSKVECNSNLVDNQRKSGTVFSIEPPPYPYLAKSIQLTRSEQINNPTLQTRCAQSQPVLPVKQSHLKAVQGFVKMSIVNQPLPNIPPKLSANQRNQQPLSASNLDIYRSNNINISIKNSNDFQDRSSQTKRSTASTINPLQMIDQPPKLPPKNRKKVVTRLNLKQNNSKQTHLQSVTKTLPHSQKPLKYKSDERDKKCTNFHNTDYSTFGYDYSVREIRSCRTESEKNRHIMSQNYDSSASEHHFKQTTYRQPSHPAIVHKPKSRDYNDFSKYHDYHHVVSNKSKICNPCTNTTLMKTNRRSRDDAYSVRTINNDHPLNLNFGKCTDSTGNSRSDLSITCIS